jgi:hypothetical protein
MFRQSVTLTRDIERGRVELARLEASAPPTRRRPPPGSRAAHLARPVAAGPDGDAGAARRSFPRYRAVSSGALQLADLQQPAPPGEAYYKMLVVGDHAYAIFATPAGARLPDRRQPARARPRRSTR